jgi:nucleoside-diphosphate-sugar epimerase
MKKRLLITGAGGVLGQALLLACSQLAQLTADYSFYIATTDIIKYASWNSFTPVRVDLLNQLDRESLIHNVNPDTLIHLAWDQSDAFFRRSVSNFDWLIAGLDLLRLFAHNGGKLAVFAGSGSEYESVMGCMAEDEHKRARSSYGECKLAFTNVALPYAEQHDLQLIVARYFTIFGEYDRHMFAAVPGTINSFLKKTSVICQSPYAIRDYIYAGDAADATLEILNSKFRGVVNVASGQPRTMREVFTVIAEEMDCLELLSFNENTRTDDVFIADTSRLNNEIGFKCKTDFRVGIRKCIEWWRNNGERYVEI